VPHGIAAFAEDALPDAVHCTVTYAIPEELRETVLLGSRIEVALGTKLTTGFVVGLLDMTDVEKVKPIRSVLDDEEPALTREIIDLCRWGAEYYIAPLGEMLRVALPANMSARGKREVRLSDTSGPAIESDRPLIDALRLRPLPFDAALEITTRSAIARLRDAGTIAVVDRLLDAKGVRYDRFVILESSDGALKEIIAVPVAILHITLIHIGRSRR
jgi:primosomal protein N'